MASTDSELVTRAARGDREAFSRLLKGHHRLVEAIVGRSDVLSNERDDVHQDIWLQAWLALPRIKAPENFAAWLQGVARNVIRRRRLGRVRRDRALRMAEDAAPRSGGPNTSGSVGAILGFEDLAPR